MNYINIVLMDSRLHTLTSTHVHTKTHTQNFFSKGAVNELHFPRIKIK